MSDLSALIFHEERNVIRIIINVEATTVETNNQPEPFVR